MDLIGRSSREKAILTLHVATETHFLLWKNLKKYHAWSCQNGCDALTFFVGQLFLFDLHQVVKTSSCNSHGH